MDATRGNICNAVGTITDTLIEVLSAMATGLAEVKATLDDRDAAVVFDEIELRARERSNAVVLALSGVPVAEAVLAAGAALHTTVEAYKQAYAEAYAEAAQRVGQSSAAVPRDPECGHTDAEHARQMASVSVSAAGRMRGRDAGH